MPASSRPDAPRKSAQVTGAVSGNVTRFQEASKHRQNEVHHARAMPNAKSTLRPDSSEKQRMLKSSGGTYSKPDARVKLIPAEEITYVQHRKPYSRTVGLAGLQKRHRRRSITPPPSSRKVSVLATPSASSYKLSLSPKRLETAEHGDSLVGKHVTSSVTHQISCLKNPSPPCCKSLHPSIYPASPSLKQVLAPGSSEDHVGTEAGPSSKSTCTVENEESLNSPSMFRQQPTVVYPDRIRSAAPILRKYILPSPVSLPSVRSTEVYPNSKSGPKEAAINLISPSSKQVLSPHSSHHLSAKSGAPSKSVCTPQNGKSCSTGCNIATRSTTVPLPSVRSTEVHPNSKSGPKEAAINLISPSSKQVLSPHSSHHLSAKSGAPSKSVCTPQNGKSCSTSCNIDTRSTTVPVLQSSIVESALLNPTPVPGERSRELRPDESRIAIAPIPKKPIVKHSLPSPTPLLNERSTYVYPNSKAGLTEAVINHHSPTPNQVCSPCSSEDHLATKEGPPSNSVCTTGNELCTRSCNADPVLQSPNLESALLSMTTALCGTSTEVYPDRINTTVRTHQDPVTEHVLPSPTSLVGERSTEVHPNSTTGLCSSNNLLNKKCDTVSLHYKSIPQTHSLQFKAPAKCSTLINCDTSTEFLHNGVQEMGAPAILHTKLHKKHYQSEAPWKGNFHVTGELKHICGGLKAHFPFQIFIRVYEASKQMPETLKLEAVALSQLWPKKFKMKPPDGQDIGLFFTSSYQRPHRSFDHLIEKISSHIGLWTNIGGTELSIFSSKLLSPDYQRKDGKFYFWGIFGKRLRKNQRHHSNRITSMKNSNASQPNEDSDDKSVDTVDKLDATEVSESECFQHENGMTMDPIGGKEIEMGKSKEARGTIDVTEHNVIVSNKSEGHNKTDRINECAVVLQTPNSYPASSCADPAFLSGCCSLDSTNKSTFNIADLMVDYPTRFSLKTNRINECAVMLGTHDSNPASNCTGTDASLLTGYCNCDTSIKSTFSVADLMLHKPPVFSKNDRLNECTVALGTPDPNSASNDTATASLLDGYCSHGSANKSTSSLTDSPCKPANVSSAGSAVMLDTPIGFPLKTDGINGCNIMLGTPNSYPASSCTAPVDSFLSRCFGHDWNKSTFSLSDSLFQPANISLVGPDLMLDTHPGFSLNAPPGFTKAHCQTEAMLNTQPKVSPSVPPGFTKAHCQTEAMLNTQPKVSPSVPPGFTKTHCPTEADDVDSPSTLVMDTLARIPNNISPGFTEAHSWLPTISSTEPEIGVSTPVTKDKPLIRFSLNVPRLMKTDSLPGFTAPNTVKKVPQSPAIDKAAENPTRSSLASGASSVRNAGQANGRRITRDKVTVEDDENSEEREFPKIRRLSELYGTPQSCTEVSSGLPEKYQATEQREEQRHQGKRGMQEPPEPSFADIPKRLKVNGRLALNNIVR